MRGPAQACQNSESSSSLPEMSAGEESHDEGRGH
jgi:hypothetical protein